MKLTNDLGSDNIRDLVFSLAMPSMIAQFVSVLYSIVDRMYIGNIEGIGEIALAGVGVCGPIVTMISALALLVGMGGGPLVSIRLGAKREDEAENILSTCFIFLTALAATAMVAAFILKDRLLWWFGASEATFPYADEYITFYLSGTVFAILATGMNSFITCQGYSKVGMRSVVIGAVLNIILDPIFIFVFHMNVAGAAIATVLSQLASCIYVLSFLFSDKPALRIRIRKPELKIIGSVCLVGFTPFLIIAFDNVMLIALNSMITKYGSGARGDMLLTCNAILQSFMLIITMPLSGITGGAQAILGYNYGARRPDKIKRAQRWILFIGLVFCTTMFLIAQLIPQYFIMIFTREPEYIEMTRRIIRMYSLAVPLLAVQYTIVDGFTAMGVFKYAFFLSGARKVAFFIAVFTIPTMFDVINIFYSEPISDTFGPFVTVLFYLTVGRRMLKKLGEPASA